MIAINDDPTFNLVQVDDRRLQPQLPGITPQELEPATCKKPWYRLQVPPNGVLSLDTDPVVQFL